MRGPEQHLYDGVRAAVPKGCTRRSAPAPQHRTSSDEDDPSVYRHPHLPAAWLGQSFEASVGGEAGSSRVGERAHLPERLSTI